MPEREEERVLEGEIVPNAQLIPQLSEEIILTAVKKEVGRSRIRILRSAAMQGSVVFLLLPHMWEGFIPFSLFLWMSGELLISVLGLFASFWVGFSIERLGRGR